MRRLVPEWALLALYGLSCVLIMSFGLGKLFVAPRDNWLFMLAGVVAATASAVVAFSGQNHEQVLWRRLLVLAPLVLLLAFGYTNPASSEPQTKYQPVPFVPSLPQVPLPSSDTSKYNQVEWEVTLNDPGKAPGLDGKPFKLVGFVQTNKEAVPQLSRYVVSCCVSCVQSVSFKLDFKRPTEIADGMWLEVEGAAKVQQASGVYNAILRVTKSRQIPEPQEPYLYP